MLIQVWTGPKNHYRRCDTLCECKCAPDVLIDIRLSSPARCHNVHLPRLPIWSLYLRSPPQSASTALWICTFSFHVWSAVCLSQVQAQSGCLSSVMLTYKSWIVPVDLCVSFQTWVQPWPCWLVWDRFRGWCVSCSCLRSAVWLMGPLTDWCPDPTASMSTLWGISRRTASGGAITL